LPHQGDELLALATVTLAEANSLMHARVAFADVEFVMV
jgi:hypothetical protein